MLQQILDRYDKSSNTQTLVRSLKDGKNLSVEGLWGSADSVVSAVIVDRIIAECRHTVLISPDQEHYAFLAVEFMELAKKFQVPELNILFFPEDERLPYDNKPPGVNFINLRQECLEKLASSKPSVTITTVRALFDRLPEPERMNSYRIDLKTGEPFDFGYLTELLSMNGFERQDIVDQVGTFAVRGGIIDIYPYGQENPARIEFDGNEIHSIRIFDLLSQRSVSSASGLTIYPKLLQDPTAQGSESCLTDHLQSSAVLMMFEPELAEGRGIEHQQTIGEQYLYAKKADPGIDLPENLYFTYTDVRKKLDAFRQVHFCGISGRMHDTVTYKTSRVEEFHGHMDLLREKLEKLKSDQWLIVILCNNEGQSQRLDELLDSETLMSGVDYRIGVGELREGFYDPLEKIAVFTDHQVFGRVRRPRPVKRFKSVQALKHIRSLKPGDIVVHVDHGIARYAGLEKITMEEHTEECLKLLYQGGDKLYVPLEHFARVQKFSGEEGVEPKLNRLGSAEWERVKNKTRKTIKDIAQDLIRLYAERKASAGHAFSPDTPMQLAMESSFEFEDTPDQEKVTEEIKQDMETEVPMDRLVCGDVGYGKTEVAVRVAFKSAQDSKQVAVLVPTTILAEQHYVTFSDRLKEFPVTVDVLSRFRSKKEQQDILGKLAGGQIDIIIGTHRLLSGDVKFRDLGLLVIDEEQRFGVTHKEKIKKLKASVDTLTLTATPIPRTLHFSLMGGRDLSVISTPPHDRLPVKTEITKFDEDLIHDAVMREIHRGGQVYYVHNRVQSIDAVTVTLKEVAPKARFGIIHGQMSPQKVEDVIHRFLKKEFDVLVATTIIENGIDIPNVNTIIIDQAHQYGLAQLYQLRGRVGRSAKQAYCYLLTPGFSILPSDAVRRLQAIEEYTDLGSGFVLAMRDLEIRGAGNLLGAEQSGFINTVGFDLYCQILDETVAALKREEGLGQKATAASPLKRELKTQIKCFLNTYIPDDYVNVTSERVAVYQRLSSVLRLSELEEIEKEITDRFGAPPEETKNLFHVIRIRILADRLRIDKILIEPDFWGFEYHSAFLQQPAHAEILQAIISHNLERTKNIRLKQTREAFTVLYGFPWHDIQKNTKTGDANSDPTAIFPQISETLEKMVSHIHIEP